MNLSTTPPLNSVENIHNEYAEKWYVFVDWDIVKNILQNNYWVPHEDLRQLELSWNNLQDDPTPTMPRKSANGRFSINYNNNTISTLSQTSFILTEKDWFKREDSWKERNFTQISKDVQNNKAFQWLLRFQADIIKNIDLPPNSELIEDITHQLSTVFQIRTIKGIWDKKNKNEWEPAPEWAHCDIGINKWHIATILVNSTNLWPKSWISLLLQADQQNISEVIWTQYDNINPQLIKAQAHHQKPFDMLFFVDTPHAVSAINQEDPQQISNRDMILLMTRRFKDSEDKILDETWVSFKI